MSLGGSGVFPGKRDQWEVLGAYGLLHSLDGWHGAHFWFGSRRKPPFPLVLHHRGYRPVVNGGNKELVGTGSNPLPPAGTHPQLQPRTYPRQMGDGELQRSRKLVLQSGKPHRFDPQPREPQEKLAFFRFLPALLGHLDAYQLPGHVAFQPGFELELANIAFHPSGSQKTKPQDQAPKPSAGAHVGDYKRPTTQIRAGFDKRACPESAKWPLRKNPR